MSEIALVQITGIAALVHLFRLVRLYQTFCGPEPGFDNE